LEDLDVERLITGLTASANPPDALEGQP
jgi:hypothetical protein